MLDSTSSPLPPLVIVPTSGGHEPDRRVELWQDAAGALVLHCYSDVERLHRLYRRGCPWAWLDLDQVAAVHEHVEVGRVLLDASPDVVAAAAHRVVPHQRRA